MKEKSKKRIELAILANGGDIHLKEWCTCDPEVNFFCQYCAIFNGLNETRTLLSSLETKDKEIEKVKKEVEKSISFLAAPDMKWDQAMRILFRIVDKEYPF